MAGIGAIIKTIRGLADGRKLNHQKDELGEMTEDDVLSLVPESFHTCAKLRLSLAQSEITGGENREQIESDIVCSFENIRKAGLNKMIENASGEPVTRDEMIRLIHTLKEYAKAANTDIETLDKQTKQILESIQKKLSEHDEGFESIQQKLDDHSNNLTILSGLSAKVNNVESQFASASNKLQTSVSGLRTWLMVIGGLSILEFAYIIYLLAR